MSLSKLSDNEVQSWYATFCGTAGVGDDLVTEQQQYVIIVKFLEFLENVKLKKRTALFLTSPIEWKTLLMLSSVFFQLILLYINLLLYPCFQLMIYSRYF